MPRLRLLLPPLAAFLAVCAVLPAQRFEDLELYGPTARRWDQFGSDVSLSADYALVGTSLDDDLGADSGSAWFFGLEPGVLPQPQMVLASDGNNGDQFGCAVSVDGPVAVVGAFSANAPHTDSGAAYVFRLDPLTGSWAEETKLDPLVSVAGDHTGRDVAVAGELIVLGAPDADSSGYNSGIAYAYRYDPVLGIWDYAGFSQPS